MNTDAARATDALNFLDANCDRPTWVRAGMAAQAAGLDFEAFDQWSAQAANYSERDARDTWRSFKPGKGIGAGTLYQMAAENGWRMGDDKPTAKAKPKPAPPPRKPTPGMSAAEVYSRLEPATDRHGYVIAKGAAGVSLDNLRVVPADSQLRIAGQSMAGYLALPAFAPDKTIQSVQFIPPTGGAKKLNLPGASMAGASFIVGTPIDGSPINLNEGIGGAWACWQSNDEAAVSTFGFGNLARVAFDLRQRYPKSPLRIVADVGKESQCEIIANEVGGLLVKLPDGWPANSDVNDLMQKEDGDALAMLLESATEPPIEYPVSVAFADELPDRYDPPDEVVEGVLTAGDGSVVYGDSNSGKTFSVIDLACAVARGVPWMNRRTEPGLVIYLAAESPASVRRRLQAYQKHHGVRVPNFAIVQNSLDLFNGDTDTDRVITLVQQLERQRKQKVRLIIGDTLARLSAGANENAGQDMGLVIRRFDRIRTEAAAHFLLIHHCGKTAAAGARGWSGVRAAVDTEIEITDSPTGRCLEITKQRDLSTKGERIGFRLDPVVLGHTKWGSPATSCVVVAADAPAKQTGKRLGEVEGAVIEFLKAHRIGIKKSEVVKHFEGSYGKPSIYRAMKTLVTAQAVHEAAGMVCIAEVAK